MVVGRLLSALWGNGHWYGCPVAVIGRCIRSPHKAASDKLVHVFVQHLVPEKESNFWKSNMLQK